MFIPNKEIIQVGDLVELLENVEMPLGTFTMYHVFKVKSIGERGYDLVDNFEHKRCLNEVAFNKVQKLQ